MAKIRTYEYWHENPNVKIDTAIEYTSTKGSGRRGRNDSTSTPFFIRIPLEYQELVKTKDGEKYVEQWNSRGTVRVAACGKDEQEAIQNFSGYMKLYFSASVKTQDVILYKFEYRSKNIESKERSGSRYFYNDNDRVELLFDFHVCVKKQLAGKTSYIKRGTDGAGHKDAVAKKNYEEDTISWNEIPYTREAEDFFTELYGAMEGLCKKFTQFMGTKAALMRTLEHKQKLIS